MPVAGSRDLLELELFLNWRAMSEDGKGLKVEVPGVRR
jgi:hypothetical protein